MLLSVGLPNDLDDCEELLLSQLKLPLIVVDDPAIPDIVGQTRVFFSICFPSDLYSLEV